MPCTNGCVINSQCGGDHAYCECECHEGTLPAIPPSRERRVIGFDVPGKSVLDEVIGERNALRDEVAELLLALKMLMVRVERDDVQDRWMPDHACKECRPESELVIA